MNILWVVDNKSSFDHFAIRICTQQRFQFAVKKHSWHESLFLSGNIYDFSLQNLCHQMKGKESLREEYISWRIYFKILELVLRPVDWTSIFVDFFQNTLKIIKIVNSSLLLLSSLGLYTSRAYFLYTEQLYANSNVVWRI